MPRSTTRQKHAKARKDRILGSGSTQAEQKSASLVDERERAFLLAEKDRETCETEINVLRMALVDLEPQAKQRAFEAAWRDRDLSAESNN